jgi:hypothetical protein
MAAVCCAVLCLHCASMAPSAGSSQQASRPSMAERTHHSCAPRCRHYASRTWCSQASGRPLASAPLGTGSRCTHASMCGLSPRAACLVIIGPTPRVATTDARDLLCSCLVPGGCWVARWARHASKPHPVLLRPMQRAHTLFIGTVPAGAAAHAWQDSHHVISIMANLTSPLSLVPTHVHRQATQQVTHLYLHPISQPDPTKQPPLPPNPPRERHVEGADADRVEAEDAGVEVDGAQRAARDHH